MSISEIHAQVREKPASADVREHGSSVLPVSFPDGWVYFAQVAGDGPVKIGWSTSPRSRLGAIARAVGDEVELLLTYPAGREEERRLHARFAAASIEREWFLPVPELLGYVDGCVQVMVGRSRKRRLPTVLTREEVERLLKAPNLRAPTGLRNRIMLELMYRAGIRVGEVVALRPRDVNVEEGIIRIWDGKGGDGTAYFDAATLKLLLGQWKATRRALPKSEMLFCTLKGGPVSVRYVEQMFQRMRRRAKIETRATPHTLRHTFATELLGEGFNIREVQEALRHADISTTQLYTHVIDSQLREKIQRRRRT